MESSPQQSPEEAFVVLITQHQAALTAFVRGLVPDRAAADDILQETNVVLWKKREDYTPGTNFRAWAFTVARFQVMAFFKRQQRRKVLHFDEAVLEQLGESAVSVFEAQDERTAALERCLGKLPEEDFLLIRDHYFERLPMEEQAQRAGRSLGALRQVLYRIRGALRECIRGELSSSGATVEPAMGR